MADKLENLIRQWSCREDVPHSAPLRPTGNCIGYEQAAKIAQGQLQPTESLHENTESCEYCRQLVADFGEALAEDAPKVHQYVSTVGPAILRFRRVAYLVAASILVLISTGVILRFFASPTPKPIVLLASADVGPADEIESDMTSKGQQQFTSGDAIMFQLTLLRDCYLMVINLEPGGQLTLMSPSPSSPELSSFARAGVATQGPYRLDGETGRETFLIVATEKQIPDPIARVQQLKDLHESTKDTNSLIEHIRAWPADVKVISFNHLPAP